MFSKEKELTNLLCVETIRYIPTVIFPQWYFMIKLLLHVKLVY